MVAEAVIRDAVQAGVALYLKEGRLAYKTRAGGMPPGLLERLRAHKPQIEHYLAQIAPPGGAEERPPVIPALDRDRARLSFAQERIWAMDRLAGGSSHYNLPFALELCGDCDVGRLTQALRDIVDRHQVLRMNFVHDGTDVYQIARASADLPVEYRDLTGLPAAEIDREIRGRIEAEAAHVFDLQTDLLLRVVILKLGDARHVVVANMHHIVSDGWSIGVLIRELSATYAGSDAPPAPLEIQYADFAEWQRQTLTTQTLQAALERRLPVLESMPPLHALRTDRPRPPVFSFRGATVHRALPGSVLQGLQRVAREGGATLAIVLQTAFSILISRFSGTADVVFGTPVANREQPQLAPLIGCFINMLVLRHHVDLNRTFRELLANARDEFLHAAADQHLPFELLVEHARPERSLSHSPLFQLALVVQNNRESAFALPGLTVQPLALDAPFTKFDLTLVAKETGGELRLAWEYATDLFDAATIERMACGFERLLHSIAESSEAPVGRIELTNATDRQRLLAFASGVKGDWPYRSLTAKFEAQVARSPDETAVVVDGQACSYADLNRRANALAHCLRARGVEAGTLVGLCIGRSIEMVVALLAILKSGAAYLPLDASYPTARLQHMVADSGTRLVLTDSRFASTVPDGVDTICLDDADLRDELGAGSADDLALEPAPDQLAYIIYTSGSTGLPKGVQIEHGSLANFLEAVRLTPGFAASDRLLAVTPISFDIHVLELFLPLVSGGTVVIANRDDVVDGRRLLELVARERVTVMQATPATWRLMLAAGPWPASARLTALCGGEALDGALADELSARVQALWNMYGPTEASVWTACAPIAAQARITVGRPLANTRLYVLDESDALAPVGVPGEIVIAGAGVARGYRGRPDLDAGRFVELCVGDQRQRLYRSGDLGYWTDDGALVCLGRRDGQVKIRGFRIELEEVERQLLHTGLVEQAVVLTAGADESARLMAHVITMAGVDLDAVSGELRRRLAEHLPEYMMPAAFVPWTTFPLTPSGKVDRQALASIETAAPTVLHEPPATPSEEAIADAFGELLRVQEVSATADFFAIGGHSLLAARLVNLVNGRLGSRLGLKDVFQLRTPRQLAAQVDCLAMINSQVTHSQAPEGASLQEELEW